MQRYVDDPDVVDPCGPSPVLIHLDQLRKLTPEWLKLSFDLKRDAEADKVFGWVLEMWGYTLAATRLGIRHTVWKEFQVRVRVSVRVRVRVRVNVRVSVNTCGARRA